jgi:hypothetical protein
MNDSGALTCLVQDFIHVRQDLALGFGFSLHQVDTVESRVIVNNHQYISHG